MSKIYYYYNPFTDTYFKDRELFPKGWGYKLLTREQYENYVNINATNGKHT